MKLKYLKLKSWILATLMGSLGLAGCHSHKALSKPEPEADEPPAPDVQERSEIRLMYGVPTMNFQIRGRVMDQSGSPIGGVSVNMLQPGMKVEGTELQGDPEMVEEWLKNTAVSTGDDGSFLITHSGRPAEEVRLLLRDVDGEANGSFADQVMTLPITPDEVDREGADGWNQGTYSREVQVHLNTK